MRPILAIAIAILLLGGVYSYIRFAENIRRSSVDYKIDFADEEYSVEIRKTFRSVGDPIFGSDSLKVLFKGQPVFSRSEEIPAEEVIEIRPLKDVEVGANELYITANRDVTDAALGAILVEIKRDNILISSQTITSAAGLAEVAGTIEFKAGSLESEEDHDH